MRSLRTSTKGRFGRKELCAYCFNSGVADYHGGVQYILLEPPSTAKFFSACKQSVVDGLTLLTLGLALVVAWADSCNSVTTLFPAGGITQIQVNLLGKDNHLADTSDVKLGMSLLNREISNAIAKKIYPFHKIGRLPG